jgi:hypothetical protein
MTMQEFGNALGVAVVGSVLAHSYTSEMTRSGQPEASRRTLESALSLAERTGGDAGHALATTARTAFDHAAGVGLTVAAAVVAGGAVVAALLMPGRTGARGASVPASAHPGKAEVSAAPAPEVPAGQAPAR